MHEEPLSFGSSGQIDDLSIAIQTQKYSNQLGTRCILDLTKHIYHQ